MKTNPFVYTGRATRSEFWTITLITICFVVVVGPVIDILAAGGMHTAFILLVALFAIRVLTAVSVRRCHDLGVSGWYIFHPLYYFRIPFSKGVEN